MDLVTLSAPARAPAPTDPGPAGGAVRLRHFCRSLLDWLDAGGDQAGGLTGGLAGAIGGGATTVLAGLADEVAAYDAAVADLERLSATRLLPPPPGLADLIADLTVRRDLAARALDAVRQLTGPVPLALPPGSLPTDILVKAAPVRPWTGDPEPTLPDADDSFTIPAAAPSPPPDADDEAIADVRLEDESDVPTLADEVPGVGPERAAALCERAAACHRAGDVARAAAIYTRALEADPHRVGAWLHRGQVRLALGDADAAAADFGVVLELDDAIAEAWWWRGDAQVVAGRPDAAVADYEQALALNPSLTRARFNLAVALRLRGDLQRALAEFDQVLQDRPGHAGAHLNRGLIHLHNGERPRAADEFRAALRLDPTCEPARRHLAELVPPAPAPAKVPRRPEKRDVGCLLVECPRCGEAGEVPLSRLGKVFACPTCQGRIGLRPDGSVAEVVATKDGRWVDRSAARGRSRQGRRRRLIAAALLVVLLVPALAFGGWRAVRPSSAPPPVEPDLPADLTARADVFGKAWAANDLRTMRRLASPADERGVYPWYRRHQPPAALRAGAGDTRVAVSEQAIRPGVSAVRLRITSPRTADRPPSDLTLTWEQRAGTWYFVPGR